MDKSTQITDSVLRLKSNIEQESYRGYDPYDGLLSPVFQLPFLRSNHTIRFLAQQAIKRSPINVRPFLRIPKGENPVTLGLAIQAHVHLKKAGIIFDFKATERLVEHIASLRSPGRQFACWGYDFPWAARHAEIPAYGPTVVATGIITNALFLYWKETGCPISQKLIMEAGEFVSRDLHRASAPNGGFVFSYSPFDHEGVLNASMKAIRLLSQAYIVSQNKGHLELAQTAIQAVLQAQRPDGSWPYSLRSGGQWTDNYHTGYILDGIDEYINNTGDEHPKPKLELGFDYYITHFIRSDGRPWLFGNKSGPADCTAGGQTLLTLIRFGEVDTARKVAIWIIENMQAPNGAFYYRNSAWHTRKTTFMRWSNAWMLAGLSAYLEAENKKGGRA
jgi:hypothetical protein